KYLKRTGRVNAAKALIGTMLKINPVVWGSHNGELEVLCNVRGRKKAMSKLVELFKDRVIDPENQHIAIAHADCLEEAEQLAEMIKEAGAKEVIITMYDLCTGAHIGPGTIALFFMGKKRDGKIEG
ncbi:MAG: DegV family protein, partial [Candidatus Coproplasma sp.]